MPGLPSSLMLSPPWSGYSAPPPPPPPLLTAKDTHTFSTKVCLQGRFDHPAAWLIFPVSLSYAGICPFAFHSYLRSLWTFPRVLFLCLLCPHPVMPPVHSRGKHCCALIAEERGQEGPGTPNRGLEDWAPAMPGLSVGLSPDRDRAQREWASGQPTVCGVLTSCRKEFTA